MKRIILTSLWVMAFAILYSQPAIKIDSAGLKNLYKIDEGVYRSEQPEALQFAALEKLGIGEVLNLKYYHSDEKKAQGTNLTLHWIPMNAHSIHDEEIINALKIIQNRKRTIVIHCRHGSDRTGVIVAMYRIVFQNWSKETAIEEMTGDKFGFHHIYKNIPAYIRSVDVDYIKEKLGISIK